MSEYLLDITENAVSKVDSLLAEAEDFTLKLRVFISGGGCSGFQYGFVFEEKVEADDHLIEKLSMTEGEERKVCFIVDPISSAYLKGATIDYREDLQGAQFIIKQNPNAKTTCGCGHSFVPKEG